MKPQKVDNLEMSLSLDGEVVQAGNSNAILGDPMESLFAASRLALENGENLLEGYLVLAGAATSAVYINPGQTISAVAEGLGDVSLKVSK
jgi:2-oxo-3-hexenedioate decarboxylase